MALGKFPLLCIVNGLALILLAFANNSSRSGQDFSAALMWLSLLIMFVPTALRLVSDASTRSERIGLVVLLGLSLYMVKILHSPLDFTFHDEFLHWLTANNILDSHHLFTENSILPVSPMYPGLEIITTAFANISGISIVTAGLVTLGIGRVIFMLGLYLFYDHIGGSKIGGIATLLYTANANFVYFDSQFSYESLSLPIAITILYAIASRDEGYERSIFSKIALTLPLILVVAITHHLTGFVLTAFLILWTLLAIIRWPGLSSWATLAIITATVFLAVFGWSVNVGQITTNYLLPVFRGGINEVINIVFDNSVGRDLFQNAAGGSSPVWESVVAILSVVGIILILPIGILQILISPFRKRPLVSEFVVIPATTLQSWQHYRNSAAAFALALVVVLQPLMQAFRLTSSGWEIANRSSEFLFWAIAFVLAVAVIMFSSLKQIKRIWPGAFVVWISIIFVGGAISGWPPWARQPGSYLVSADTRSIESEGILAAKWVGSHLPANNRMSADRINTLLMSVYGQQRLITHIADKIYLASVFFSLNFGASERELLAAVDADYLVVDTRLSEMLPLVGVYFEGGEPFANQHREPFDLAALLKFDTVDNVSRIFDSGHLKIYDVRATYEAS